MAENDPGASPSTAAPEVSNNAPTATVESIAAEVAADKPTVQEHAIAQADAERIAQQGKDVNGQPFNPAIHAANADGSPRKTARGAWALKRGRKSSGTAANGSTAASAPASPGGSNKGIVVPGAAEAAKAKNESLARQGGAQCAALAVTLAVGMLGQEWAPRKPPDSPADEMQMLAEATGDYFVSKNWQDLPPGAALVAAVAMYSLPRLRMPQTQSRIQKFRIWVGSKIGAWKARRIAKRRGVPESDIERAERDSRQRYQQEKQGASTSEVGGR